MGCRGHWYNSCSGVVDYHSRLADYTSCWKENREGTSFSCRRSLCFHSCDFSTLWSASKDQIWTSSLLDSLINVLVPGFWCLGI